MNMTMAQDETVVPDETVPDEAARDEAVRDEAVPGGEQGAGAGGARERAIGADGGLEGGRGGDRGDGRDAPPSPAVIVLALAVAGLGHAVVSVAGIAIGLVLVLSGSSLAGWPPGGASGRGVSDVGPAEAPAEPRGEEHPSHDDARGDAGDDVVRLDDLDAFADLGHGGDARLRVGGDPGAGWTESRVGGRVVWVDALCRLQADVIRVEPTSIGDQDVSDAGPSEALARAVGEVVLGSRAARSDPEPAVVRMPLSGGGSVELASVALAPVDPIPDEPSVLVVAARASATQDRAVVVALACVDTPVAGADARARDLVGRLHLESAP